MAGTEKTGRQQFGRFQPGRSGNPSGRPRGARNKATLAVEALLEGEAEALGRKAIELAMEGDTTALRLCLERIAPPRKGRPVVLDLPPVLTVADLSAAQAVVVAAMGAGDLTTDEAADVAKVLEAVGASIERRDLEARIAALEAEETTE